jgi:DNA processing protein
MNGPDGEERYWLWLASVDGVFSKWFYKLLGAFFEPRAVWENAEEIPRKIPDFPKDLARNILKAKNAEYLDGLVAYMEESRICYVTASNAEYPYPLHDLNDPPPVLYYKGTLPNLWERSVSVVGTRKPTRNGAKTAETIAAELGSQGVLIVSGMARGIDAAAHKGAIAAGGTTVAVLGCGADVVYPKENEEIYKKIQDNGAVVSEFKPKSAPIAGNFPKRNRIIAALSCATVVSEGGEKSGARITADVALSLGRQVFAIPCDIGSSVSSLPVSLIKSGAEVLAGSRDLMEYMGWKTGAARRAKKNPQKYVLDFLQEQIYNSLLKGDSTLEMLAEELEAPIGSIGAALTRMELMGAIDCLPGNRFSASV